MGKKKKKKVVLTQDNKKGHSKNGKSKGHQKNKYDAKHRDTEREIREQREKHASLEHQYLVDYARSITSHSKRPFSLKYFGKEFNESKLTQYEYEIKKARWLSNPKTLPRLIDICNEHLRNVFGPDGPDNYQIPSGYRLKDVPKDKPSREPEEYVFTHSDKRWEGFMKARKVPIGEWETQENTRMSKIKTRKYLLNVDGQILLGEVTVETTKAYDNIEKGAKSGIKFSIYYRGKEDGKFIVDRWDYEPLSEHLNKFDKAGYFQTDGVKVPKTSHSHEHRYTLHNRLVLTQNQSPDICPTPINSYSNSRDSEIRYGSFGSMVTDFENVFNLGAIQVPNNELAKTPLRKIGRTYCPEWNTELNEEFPAMVDLDSRVCGKLSPNTKILGNGQITLDIDAVIKEGYTIPVTSFEEDENVEDLSEDKTEENTVNENQIEMDLLKGDDGGMVQ